MQPAEAQRDEWLNPWSVKDVYQTVDAKEQPVILYMVYLKYQEFIKRCVSVKGESTERGFCFLFLLQGS